MGSKTIAFNEVFYAKPVPKKNIDMGKAVIRSVALSSFTSFSKTTKLYKNGVTNGVLSQSRAERETSAHTLLWTVTVRGLGGLE